MGSESKGGPGASSLALAPGDMETKGSDDIKWMAGVSVAEEPKP